MLTRIASSSGIERMRVDKFRCRDWRRPCPCRAHESLSAVAPCSYLSLRLVLRPRRLMRIRATGKEIREGSGYGKSTRSTLRTRVLYIVESSCFMIRSENVASVLDLNIYGWWALHFKPKPRAVGCFG